MEKALIHIDRVSKIFSLKGKKEPFYALRDISLQLPTYKTVALVGESGSGKSTIAKILAGLMKEDSGVIYYGDKLLHLARKEKSYKLVQMVFQDPYSSLNPRKRIGDIFKEIYHVHIEKNTSFDSWINNILNMVGITPELLKAYPFQLSGGQRQRISIARAICVMPEFLILDEPTSALDVSVQAQILELFNDLKSRLSMTTLFISHNIGVVELVSDYLAVMLQGRILETGSTKDILMNSRHPYSRLLIQTSRDIFPDDKNEPVEEKFMDEGCPFANRCNRRLPVCSSSFPRESMIGENHTVYCHNPC
ncbi:MAG: ABC transporter ATP-binding protein [Calditrichia bacterium]